MRSTLLLLATTLLSLASAQFRGPGGYASNPYYALEAREPDPFDDVYQRSAMDFDDTIFELE